MAFASKLPKPKQTAYGASARPFATRRASGLELGSGSSASSPKSGTSAHIRLMDSSAYLLARNNITNEVHTLAQAQYRQISEVRFEPRLAGFGLKYEKVAHGLPDVNAGMSRPPALVGGSSMANELVNDLRFVVTHEC